MKKINLEDLKQAITEYLNGKKGKIKDIEPICKVLQDFLIDYERKHNPKLKKLREKKIQIENEIKEMEEQETKIHWPGPAAE